MKRKDYDSFIKFFIHEYLLDGGVVTGFICLLLMIAFILSYCFGIEPRNF